MGSYPAGRHGARRAARTDCARKPTPGSTAWRSACRPRPRPAAEAHRNLMLTKALDLSAKRKQAVKLPLEPGADPHRGIGVDRRARSLYCGRSSPKRRCRPAVRRSWSKSRCRNKASCALRFPPGTGRRTLRDCDGKFHRRGGSAGRQARRSTFIIFCRRKFRHLRRVFCVSIIQFRGSLMTCTELPRASTGWPGQIRSRFWWSFLLLVSAAATSVLLMLLPFPFPQANAHCRRLGSHRALDPSCARPTSSAAPSGPYCPRADVQRICLFDTWLSSIVRRGRSVATIAEVCFVAQWAIVLRALANVSKSDAGPHHRERHRSADPGCGVLFMVRGDHHELPRQRGRKFDMGRWSSLLIASRTGAPAQ